MSKEPQHTGDARTTHQTAFSLPPVVSSPSPMSGLVLAALLGVPGGQNSRERTLDLLARARRALPFRANVKTLKRADESLEPHREPRDITAS